MLHIPYVNNALEAVSVLSSSLSSTLRMCHW